MVSVKRFMQTSDLPAMFPVFICRLVVGIFFLPPGLINYS